jgi:hypothetical protein
MNKFKVRKITLVKVLAFTILLKMIINYFLYLELLTRIDFLILLILYIFTFIFNSLIVYFIHLNKNWARLAWIVFFLISIPSLVLNIYEGIFTKEYASFLLVYVCFFQLVIQGWCTYILMTKDIKRFFTSSKN